MTIKIMKWASKNLKSLPPPRKSKHVPTQEMAEITLIYSRKGKNGQYWVLQPDHDVDGEAFLFKNQLDQKRFAKCESFIAWLKSMPTGCISRPPAKILIATKVNSQGFTRVASLQCAADIPETQWIENVRQRGDSIRKEWQAGSDWTSDLHGALEIALEQDGYAYVPDEEIGSTISANEREQILDEVILVYQTEGKRIENRVGFAAIVVTPKKTNHVLHLIISFVSGGLWLPMWLLVALKNRDEREILHVNEYGSVTLSPAKGRVLIPK
ncbi:MAG: hypothetical protein OXG68_12065, partial [Chloroflexi bacterium]|nr:hypothetical protein [Chloroflexota bacterium]